MTLRRRVSSAHSAASEAARFILIGLRSSRRTFLLSFVLNMIASAASLLTLVALRDGVEAVIGASGSGSLRAVVVFGVASGVSSAADLAAARLNVAMRESVAIVLDREIAALSLQSHTIEHYDRPEYFQRLDQLEGQRGVVVAGPVALVSALGALFSVLASLALIMRTAPELAFIVVGVAPSLWLSRRAERLHTDAVDAISPSRRAAAAILETAVSRRAAAEVRVFGLRGLLSDRFASSWSESEAASDAAGRQTLVLNLLRSAWFGLLALGVALWVARLEERGMISVGEAVLVIGIALQIAGQLGATAQALSWLDRAMRAASHYRWLEVAATNSDTSERPSRAAPSRLRDGVVLEAVSFRYPDSDHNALVDISVEFRAGRVVAIVGNNGAGKSTLVKLLCGFYAPLSGHVTVDGINLSEVDPLAWRANLAAVFQDFSRPAVSLREAIGIGDVRRLDDDVFISNTANLANAADLMARTNEGLDAMIGREFGGILEPSGGEWQRLAVARALMKTSPILLVLDEPSAELDPEAEHDLFQLYARQARAASAERGAITVLISHRFNTVKMADDVLVLADGKVVEFGPREELLRSDESEFARLFRLQAKGYQ